MARFDVAAQHLLMTSMNPCALRRIAVAVESLESRRLLSTEVFGPSGRSLGRLDTYTPPGGLQAVDVAAHRPGRGTSEQAGFQIDVEFNGGLTASQQAVFTAAAARWERIITGDIEDVGPG